MDTADYHKKLHELVLNWKLRLIASALFSILGLAVLISTTSGLLIEDFEILDQTIVGVAVFVIVIPIYLIIADLPKIDEETIAKMLNETVPDLNSGAELVLKSTEELSEQEKEKRREVEVVFNDDKLYRFLPNYPMKQAVVLLLGCLLLTAGIYYYFQNYL
ncbi:MAG: hypothetical protein R3224_07300 [Balneolaceae bacterium]|nr:hypothetical protein [Balneolaceae bacterium]